MTNRFFALAGGFAAACPGTFEESPTGFAPNSTDPGLCTRADDLNDPCRAEYTRLRAQRDPGHAAPPPSQASRHACHERRWPTAPQRLPFDWEAARPARGREALR